MNPLQSPFPTYLHNLLKLTRGNRDLAPQIAVYYVTMQCNLYVTMQCNLNCAYCEDFGSRRNGQVTQNPPLEDAKKILRVIRSGFSRLWLTGGEPLAHPQILELLSYARNELKFQEISLITNGTLLGNVVARSDPGTARQGRCSDEATSTHGEIASGNEQERPRNDVLSLLDRLIISLDSLDPRALSLVSLPNLHAEDVIANVREAAKLQKSSPLRLYPAWMTC